MDFLYFTRFENIMRNSGFFHVCLVFFFVLRTVICGEHPILYTYPFQITNPFDGRFVNVSQNEFTCFEFGLVRNPRSLMKACLCLIPGFPVTCPELWGSITTAVKVLGNVEFVKVSSVPTESQFKAVRLMELTSSDDRFAQDFFQLPDEPTVLCARSVSDTVSRFSFELKASYIRDVDAVKFKEHLVYHFLLLWLVCSVWRIPYLMAFISMTLSFLHGLKFFGAILGSAITVLATTPLMLTQRNRSLSLMYMAYFFGNAESKDSVKSFLNSQRPVFQSLYFSSALVTVGSAALYLLYHYFGIDREIRNALVRVVIAISIAWLTFCVSRSFDKILYDWFWIVIVVASLNMVESLLNPSSRLIVFLATMIASSVMVLMLKILTHRYRFLIKNAFSNIHRAKSKSSINSGARAGYLK
jgi:hypothetical protein